MDNQHISSAGTATRRDFIKKTATATAAVAATGILKTPVYGQDTAPSTGRVLGANDRIVVGFIGVGGQGMAHVRSMTRHAQANNIGIGPMCDVWTARQQSSKQFVNDAIEKEEFAKGLKPLTDNDVYEDHRKLLERKDVDAVCISTVDHWHAKCSIDALNAGKHVYVEKPMTRYLGEAWDIYDACKKTSKILQVGSQGCSDGKWHKAAELIKAGKIGPLVQAQGSYMRNDPKGEWNYPIDQKLTEDTIKWNHWLGDQIKDRTYFSPDHYFRWRKYYPYCAGLLGDLFPHRLHPLMLATGNPEFPSRVASIGNRKIETDRNTPGTFMRDVDEMVQLIAEFPSGLSLLVMSATVNEQGNQDMIRGHKATLYMAGNRVELRPEKPFTEEIDPEPFEGIKPGEDISVHEKNWFESIRANKQPNAGIELAIRVQTVISLAEMSDRMNVMCLFDEKSRKITTADGKELKPLTYGSLSPS